MRHPLVEGSAVQCAHYNCALLVGRVKVECHRNEEFGCGKALTRSRVDSPNQIAWGFNSSISIRSFEISLSGL